MVASQLCVELLYPDNIMSPKLVLEAPFQIDNSR